MKRFFSLLAMAVAPVMAFAADAPQASSSKSVVGEVKDNMLSGPVSAADETWAARTELGWAKQKHHTQGFQANTIQPLYRGDDMCNTCFFQGGVGAHGQYKNAYVLGLGYRYLTTDTSNMFGINMFYNDQKHKRDHGFGMTRGYDVNLEWFTQYTTVSFGRHLHTKGDGLGKWKTWGHFFEGGHGSTTLDLAFQVPYLPWTEFTLGYDWHTHRKNDLAKLDYTLNLNLISCVSLQGGYHRGWNKSPFARLVVNFGRAASQEHTLADKFFGDEAFTARNLTNSTLKFVPRADLGYLLH